MLHLRVGQLHSNEQMCNGLARPLLGRPKRHNWNYVLRDAAASVNLFYVLLLRSQVNSSSLPNTTVIYVGTTTPADVNTGGATLPGDSWSVAPAPVDTCGKALPSIAPLSVTDAAPAGVASTKLQSALRGIGSLSNCAVSGNGLRSGRMLLYGRVYASYVAQQSDAAL